MPGLDPVVAKTMAAAFSLSNKSTLHMFDEQRWMSLFPALVAKGYRWHMDDIGEWLSRWPGSEDDSGMDNHDAIRVYAWAEIALEQAAPSDGSDWGASIVQRYEDELAG